jgi:hypothetical protein
MVVVAIEPVGAVPQQNRKIFFSLGSDMRQSEPQGATTPAVPFYSAVTHCHRF